MFGSRSLQALDTVSILAQDIIPSLLSYFARYRYAEFVAGADAEDITEPKSTKEDEAGAAPIRRLIKNKFSGQKLQNPINRDCQFFL